MSNSTNCLFCSRQAVIKNKQKFPVCSAHKNEDIPEMICVCKEILSIKEGKFGAFFLCPSCGPISTKKAVEINNMQKKDPQRTITVRSDEVDLI
ncbi:MAG: hypothetical protein KJ583_04260 [Nanoarchaeota archaeon]|nr:hypothetical protein [Nanoarchaeota archaeon]MBU1269102.1 hypothetical protein [Nanoarchaeota archaeon]MBU1604506.1 hypothetical protein [Nanoarchaeota archaeon]MBU2443742.1 hypothetical protein [Nanoarchaeota archaeon]